ncbi:MAG: Sec-independent protein translocase protein TatA [Actinomycetota bacterium]|jgi:sec-independent protein translocase protein TatA
MGKIFESPVGIILILIVVLLIGAPKLPGLAKSLGQSMRIFRKEIKHLNEDKDAEKGTESKKSETKPGDDSESSSDK